MGRLSIIGEFQRMNILIRAGRTLMLFANQAGIRRDARRRRVGLIGGSTYSQ
jgi:hypothetical protein